MSKRKKGILWLLLVVAIATAAWFIGRSYLLDQMKQQLEHKLQALRKSGLDVTYDSITIDWKNSQVDVMNISIRKVSPDTACQKPESIAARHVHASGFNLLPLLIKKQLRFDLVEITEPHIVLQKNSTLFGDSAKRKQQNFSLKIDLLRLPGAKLEYIDSAACNTTSSFSSNVEAHAFSLALFEDRKPAYAADAIAVDSVTVHLPGEFYTLTVRAATLNLDLGIFDLDTLRIIPHYEKVAFGRKRGYETDRVEGTVPYLNLSGLKLYYEDTLLVRASKATLQAFVKVFRDKRLPFNNKPKLLPIAMLKQMRFGLHVDELVMNKSYVEYEEFLDNADSSGVVFFDNLFATVRNINNTSYSPNGETTLTARAALMGQGDVRIKAVCPWNEKRKYTIRGTVERFKIPEMNAILEPAAQVRAESGYLNSLGFWFTYDERHANGEIELNYNDLKLTTFKEVNRPGNGKKGDDDDDVVKKDGLKTFILNTFIIRRDMDEKVPEEKRSGTISFDRDPKKSIFNYWWKSLFSGVKSAYNLDKLEERKARKLQRKKDK